MSSACSVERLQLGNSLATDEALAQLWLNELTMRVVIDKIIHQVRRIAWIACGGCARIPEYTLLTDASRVVFAEP